MFGWCPIQEDIFITFRDESQHVGFDCWLWLLAGIPWCHEAMGKQTSSHDYVQNCFPLKKYHNLLLDNTPFDVHVKCLACIRMARDTISFCCLLNWFSGINSFAIEFTLCGVRQKHILMANFCRNQVEIDYYANEVHIWCDSWIQTALKMLFFNFCRTNFAETNFDNNLFSPPSLVWGIVLLLLPLRINEKQ